MLNFIKKKMGKQAVAMMSALFICGGINLPVQPATCTTQVANIQSVKSWKKFHLLPGKCAVSLPEVPEHAKQIMPFPKEGYDLRYDVYLSAFERKAIYIMLIAQCPPFIDDTHAELSFESLLNGLVAENHDNKLIFADLIEFQGHKALDFFINSKGVYFKGRAIMANKHLYLLGMRCEKKHYLEEHFNHFLSSFEIIDE